VINDLGASAEGAAAKPSCDPQLLGIPAPESRFL